MCCIVSTLDLKLPSCVKSILLNKFQHLFKPHTYIIGYNIRMSRGITTFTIIMYLNTYGNKIVLLYIIPKFYFLKYVHCVQTR